MSYFLDTNICIYLLKGAYPHLADKIMTYHPDEIKIPAVVKAELLYGAEKSVKRKENMELIEALLMPMDIVPFGDSAAGHYASVRSTLERAGTPIGPNDLLIAATVLAENGILVTNNVREFERVPALQIEDWTNVLC